MPGDFGIALGQLLELFMASYVRLHEGQLIGWHPLFDNLPAQAALQDVIGPPRHFPSILEAMKELLRKTAAFHPIQGGHLVEESGSLLFKNRVIVRHGCIVYYSTQLRKQKKRKIQAVFIFGYFFVLHPVGRLTVNRSWGVYGE